MSYVTLNEAKDQVSIEHADDSSDDRLTRLIAAAEKWAENFLNAPLADFEESPVQSPPELPEDLKSGILLHIEAEFDRDMQNFDTIMKRAHDLLWPYRQELGV
jgi:lysyl-tRNA synthetase class I